MRQERSDQVGAAASAIDTNISPRRPRFSDTAPAQKIASASAPVANDNGSEAVAASTPNARANSGSTGCTLYSSEKVAKPARNNANRMRPLAGASMAGGWVARLAAVSGDVPEG